VADTSRRVKALGYAEQLIEASGQKPYLEFLCKDGSVVRLNHPRLLDDEALLRVEAFQRGDGLDREPVLDEHGNPKIDPNTGKPMTVIIDPPHVNGQLAEPYVVRLMKAVLGEEDYAKLRANGLTALALHEAFESLSESQSSDPDPKDNK